MGITMSMILAGQRKIFEGRMSKPKDDISVDYLREIFDYDPDRGLPDSQGPVQRQTRNDSWASKNRWLCEL